MLIICYIKEECKVTKFMPTIFFFWRLVQIIQRMHSKG